MYLIIQRKITRYLLLLFFFAAGCTQQNETEFPENPALTGSGDEVPNAIDEIPEEAEQIPEMSLKKERSFGDSDDVMIGSHSGFTVDVSGRVFIGDRGQNNIHVFDSSGQYLESIGREGEGPGEFRNVAALNVSQGQLYALDGALIRINIYSLDSLTFSHTIDYKQGQADVEELKGSFLRFYFVLDDNSVIMVFSKQLTDAQGEKTIPFFQADEEGKFIPEKVFELEDGIYLEANRHGFRYLLASPFHGLPLFAVSGKGEFFTARTDKFVINKYNLNGELLDTFEHPFRKSRLTREDAYNHDEDRFEEGVFEEMLQETNLPETWPALDDLLLDDENRLWVSTIVDDFEVYEWWVLTEEGELLWKLIWPRDKPIKEIKKGFVYTHETEAETGIQYVVRYRISGNQ